MYVIAKCIFRARHLYLQNTHSLSSLVFACVRYTPAVLHAFGMAKVQIMFALLVASLLLFAATVPLAEARSGKPPLNGSIFGKRANHLLTVKGK